MKPVYFVAFHLRSRWPELVDEDACLPLSDVPRSRWAPLENIWIVSTYLRLKARGANVKITDRPVVDHINVCCDEALAGTPGGYKSFMVFIQGDRADLGWGDFLLVQSPAMVAGPETHLIGHWPQPDLIPRDKTRGTRVERLGYVGPLFNLGKSFKDKQFQKALAELGVEFIIRDDPERWHDFSDLDLYLAVRDWPWHNIRTKPATKLVHSWLTGAVALLGAEPSYRYWGKAGTDYFEVLTPDDVISVVKRLRQEPGLYSAAQEAGRGKAPLHDEESVCRQWLEALSGPIHDAFSTWQTTNRAVVLTRRLKHALERPAVRIRRRLFYLRSEGIAGLRRRIGHLLSEYKPSRPKLFKKPKSPY